MSAIKLTADSGGGSVALKGPATTGSNGNRELIVPDTYSGNGSLVTADSSDNVDLAGTLDVTGAAVFDSTGYFASNLQVGTASTAGTYVRAQRSDAGNVWSGNSASTNTSSITEAGAATFAGSVKIGGTAAANEIDEYEEGTFTPTASNFTVSGTTTLTGNYVKVGRQVTVGIQFANTGTIAHATSAFITLPFSLASGTSAYGLIGMAQASNSAAFDSNIAGTQCLLDSEGGSRFLVGAFTTTASGMSLIFGGTYIAAS